MQTKFYQEWGTNNSILSVQENLRMVQLVSGRFYTFSIFNFILRALKFISINIPKHCLLILTIGCILLSSCEYDKERKLPEANAVLEGSEEKAANFAINFGESFYIADYDFIVVTDTFHVLRIDDYDAISYCGQYGYRLRGKNSEKNTIVLDVVELTTGKVANSAKLADIIQNSVYAKEMTYGGDKNCNFLY